MLAIAIEASILINYNESFCVADLLDTFRYTLKQFISLRGGYTPYNGKKIQIGPRASIFGYVIDLSKCYNF